MRNSASGPFWHGGLRDTGYHPLENVMKKSVLAIATVIVALPTMLASSAEAHGFGMHFGFGVPIFNSYSSDSGSYSHREYDHSYQARRTVRETVHVAKKSSQTNVAKANADESVRAASLRIPRLQLPAATSPTPKPPLRPWKQPR